MTEKITHAFTLAQDDEEARREVYVGYLGEGQYGVELKTQWLDEVTPVVTTMKLSHTGMLLLQHAVTESLTNMDNYTLKLNDSV